MNDQTRPHADREGLNPFFATTVFQGVSPVGGWPAAFAIITACDPDAKKTDPAVNQSADFQLESELRIKGCRYWRVTGGSPDFAHAEPGYAAELPLSEALNIGRKYRQEAIFWIERDELIIVGCGSELRQELGSWSERLALGNGLPRSTPNFDGPPSTTDETPNTII